MRLLLALMALALAFLAGGMLLLRDPLSSSSDHSGVVAVGEGTAPESAGGAAGAMELASLIPRAEELGRAEAEGEADSLLAPRIQGLSEEDQAEAKAAVEGRVLGATARPLVGAEVRLYRRGDRPGEPSGTCDEGGRFVVEGAGGKARLEVTFPGYVSLEREVRLETGATLDFGDISMVEGGQLIGRVVDRDGRGVAGARIQALQDSSIEDLILGWGGWSEGVETDPQGHFTITDQAVGSYEYRVSHEAFVGAKFDGELSRAGMKVEGILVTLERGGAVQGRVTGLPGWSEKASWRVSATRSGQGFLTLGSGNGLGAREAELEPDGSFRLTGLDPGVAYGVELEGFGGGILPGQFQRSNRVTVRAGDRGVQIPYSEGASVEMRLVDEEGEPVHFAEVLAGFDWASPEIPEDEELAGGVARVERLFPKEGGQVLQVEVKARGKAPWKGEVRVQPDERVDLGVVRLLSRASLRVTVLTAEGDPLPGAKVRAAEHLPSAVNGSRTISRRVSMSMSSEGPGDLSMPVDLSRPAPSAETDDEGVCVLAVEEGSTVDVTVSHADHPQARTGPVTVSSSGSVTEHLVRLAAPGWVAVTVVDGTGRALPDVIVEYRQDGGRRSKKREPARTGADGSVTLGAFAAGPARFKVGDEPADGGRISLDFDGPGLGLGDGEGWTEAKVVEGAVTELTLVAPNRVVVTGVVTENGQPLAGARVVLASPEGSGPELGFLGLGSSGPSTETDGRGEFRFDSVTEGEYELRISHPTRVMDDRFDVEVEAIDTRFEADLKVALIEGRVLDATGQPVVGARVSARRPSAGGQRSIGIVMMGSSAGGAQVISSDEDLAEPVLTDREGRYSLRGVSGDTELVVKAQSDEEGTVETEPIVVETGTITQGVDLRFAEAGTVTVLVEGAAEGTMVMGRSPGGETPQLKPVVEGRAVFSGLAPGRHRFQLVGAPSEGAVDTQSQSVEVEAGEEHEVRLGED
jgi:protocatechuate 3,4-dioxygenase beta subunit